MTLDKLVDETLMTILTMLDISEAWEHSRRDPDYFRRELKAFLVRKGVDVQDTPPRMQAEHQDHVDRERALSPNEARWKAEADECRAKVDTMLEKLTTRVAELEEERVELVSDRATFRGGVNGAADMIAKIAEERDALQKKLDAKAAIYGVSLEQHNGALGRVEELEKLLKRLLEQVEPLLPTGLVVDLKRIMDPDWEPS